MRSRKLISTMLLALAFLVFAASIVISFLFFQFDYPVKKNTEESHSIDVPLENLIPGNTTANIAQFIIPEDRADIRKNYGSFCSCKDDVFYYTEQRNKQYIMRNSLANPDAGAPIAEGYDASYLSVYNNTLYFIGAKDTEKYKIYSCGLNGGTVDLVKEEDSNITSMVSNSNYLYYTTDNSPSVNYLCYDGKRAGVLLNKTSNNSNIKLIGSKAQYLYYLSESGTYELNLLDMSERVLSHQCCSLYQYPMITDKGLLYFSDLSSKEYVLAPFTGGETFKVFDSSFFSGFPRTISYDSGYLFVLSNDSVYYTALGESNASQIKGVTVTEKGTFRIANGYCIYNDDEKISSVGINWILAT